MGKNQHVVPRDGGWVVQGAGTFRATSQHSTQADAIKAAVHIAKAQKSDVVIRGKNGQIRGRDSYGNDRCPPKGRKH